jgi:hypothetical protein
MCENRLRGMGSSRRSLFEGLGRSNSDIVVGNRLKKRNSFVAGSKGSIVFEDFGSSTDVVSGDPFVSIYNSCSTAPLSTAAVARVPPPRLKSRCPSVADWSVVTPATMLASARRRSSALLANAIAEAGLNSLDACNAWDYTMELECLHGPDGIAVLTNFLIHFFCTRIKKNDKE